MSNKILLKRSGVANAAPGLANISLGELAINTRDGKLYTKISDGVDDLIFELTQNQLITLSGDATGNGINTIPVLLNSTQSNITAVGNLTSLTVVGNIDGSNVSLSGNLSAAGNITGEYLIANNAIVGNVSFTDIFTGNITANGFANIAGNVTGGNIITVGNVEATGNVAGDFFIGNGRFLSGIDTTLISNGATEVRTYENGNVAFTINGIANVVVVTENGITVVGNTDSGNVNTGFVSVTGDIEAGGNITTGNGSGGNISGANVVSANTFVASANISAAGATVTGNITAGNIATAGTVDAAIINATGNITGGNLTTAGLTSTATLSVSGNANVGNLATAGLITATGNITGGNLVTAGETFTGTLRSSGDALINGNLIVSGNLKYINVEDLRVQDPVIILGTGPNGAPLTENDGLDRGVYMEYYTTDSGNAFVGWQNSTGNMIIASNVEFASNDIVQVNSYGTLQAGNAYLESADVIGNITAGNISTSGALAVTGNVSGANLNAVGNLTGLQFQSTNLTLLAPTIGNTAGERVRLYDFSDPAKTNYAIGVETSAIWMGVDTNLEGQGFKWYGSNVQIARLSAVGNLIIAGNFVANANITGANLVTTGVTSSGTLSVIGNATVGNLTTAGLITATGNITGGNLITVGNANISGNAAVGGILTDNYFYANGTPVDFEQPAGANTEIQYNLDGDFGASSKFTFNQDTDVLTVIGNIEAANLGATTVVTTGNITGANLNTAGKVTATGNVAGGNINTGGQVVATGNVTGANIVTGGQVLATGSVTGGNLITSGNGNIATLTVSTFANVTANTAATSNNTGALRVAGGVGIGGDLYASDMYSNGDLVLTVESTIDGGTY